MAQRDSSNKVALSKLRGKSSNQSVPSISFRFNTTSEDITEVLDVEDDESSLQSSLSVTPTDVSTADDVPSRSGTKIFPQRSASLDSNQGSDIPSPKAVESSSLLSRLTKTFEHKISEIRKDNQKDTKGPLKEIKNGGKNESLDESKIVEAKPKTSLVQEFSEFRDSIRPKLTELRNRKTTKEKSKTSLLTSLLGREALMPEEVTKDCEQAIEAQEDFIEPVSDIVTAPIEQTVSFSRIEPKKVLKLDPIINESKGMFSSLMKLNNSVLYKFIIAVFLLFVIFPLNVMLGFVIGVILGGGACFYYLMNVPDHIKYKSQDKKPHFDNFQIPILEENTPYEGWMNELSESYSPDTYHVCQTHSVFIRLHGSLLQIDHPKRKISKHARSKEELDCRSFVHHREYNMKECEIMLLPHNLPRRWLWSRKYPIFIQIKKKENINETTPFASFGSIPQETVEQEICIDNKDKSSKIESLDDELMSSSVELDSYEEVTVEMCQEKSLTLFARSDREKDDWFRRFVVASENDVTKTEDEKTPENESVDLTPSEEQTMTDEFKKKESPKLDFAYYMAHLQQNNRVALDIGWFNSIVGRIFFDFLHSQYWANKIQERIQRKLSKLHLPYFVGEIIVCGVDLGTTIPILLSAERPSVNERGVWVDLAMSYNGNLTLSLETKLDLMKLKERSGTNLTNPPSPTDSSQTYNRSPSNDCFLHNINYDTDTDDSIESSSEEEYEEEAALESSLRGSSGPASKRFLRIVDTVAASRYFQQASEWRVLQRAMVGVSKTRIELCVEVRRLEGLLTVNIPPPPSDRLWYGFRNMPELDMLAKPSLGQRPINLPFLTDYIEKELRTVFEKVFVLPNMDDLVIPVMSPLLPGQSPPPRPWENQRSSSPKSPSKETNHFV